jgi:5-hydroxyisourate hydrolase-like protein (transthyretin family)
MIHQKSSSIKNLMYFLCACVQTQFARMRTKNTLGLALIIGIALVLCSFTVASAHTTAGGNGQISGQLLDGTNKNTPLAGQTVTLQMAQGQNAQDFATAKTDAQGNYTFTNLAIDKTISYALYIRYQGAQYTSDLISLASKPQQQMNLTIYEATQSSAKVAVVDATILMQDPSAHNGTFTVSEVYDFKNLDTHTYVGSLDASKGRPNALLFSLPTGARNIKLQAGFDGYQVIQINSGFATDAALPPGDSEFAFSFDVPYSGTAYNLNYTTLYPTVSLSFLVPPDIHANPHALTAQGTVTGSDQHIYQSFKTSTVLANTNVGLDLTGLATPTANNQSSPLNLGSLWLVVGLLVMVAIIFVTAFIYRVQQRLFPEKRGQRPSFFGKKRHHHQKQSTSQRKDRKDELLHELLALDKAYEDGKMSKSTYQERRAKVKARLRSLMSDREEEARR